MNQVILPNMAHHNQFPYYELWCYYSDGDLRISKPFCFFESQLLAIVVMEMLKEAYPRRVYSLECCYDVRSPQFTPEALEITVSGWKSMVQNCTNVRALVDLIAHELDKPHGKD